MPGTRAATLNGYNQKGTNPQSAGGDRSAVLTPEGLAAFRAATGYNTQTGEIDQSRLQDGYLWLIDVIEKYGGVIEPNVVYWITEAQKINAGTGGRSAEFVRAFNVFNAEYENGTFNEDGNNTISNRIATSFLTRLADTGHIPSIAEIIAIDAGIAINQFGDGYAGWSGSFYFWQMPVFEVDQNGEITGPKLEGPDDFLTLGEVIARDPAQRDRFLSNLAHTLASMDGFWDFVNLTKYNPTTPPVPNPQMGEGIRILEALLALPSDIRQDLYDRLDETGSGIPELSEFLYQMKRAGENMVSSPFPILLMLPVEIAPRGDEAVLGAMINSLKERYRKYLDGEFTVEDFNQMASIGVAGFSQLTAGQILGSLGSVLGQRITDDEFGQLVTSAAFETVLGGFGNVIDDIVRGAGLNAALDDLLSDIGPAFQSNIISGGIGAVSSYLTAELFDALGVGGVVGELGQTLTDSYVSAIIESLPDLLKAAGAPGSTTIQDVLSGVQIWNVVGSFIGKKLANEIKSFETVGGQIGAAVGGLTGGVVGANILSGLASSANPALVALAANPLAIVGIVAAVVVFNTLIGGLIGSIFGGTPRSGADVAWDDGRDLFVTANEYSRKGGNKEAARNFATAVAGNLNAVLHATGSKVLDPESIQTGNYGMRKSVLVYRPFSTTDKSAITAQFKGKNAASELVRHGTYIALSDMIKTLGGGNIYVKRALAASLQLAGGNPSSNAAGAAGSFDFSGLLGNVATANDYAKFLTDGGMISALIKAGPESTFAAGWLVTLTRASELGLNKRSQFDWNGGFATFLDEVADGEVDDQTLPASDVRALYSVEHGRYWAVYDLSGGLIGFSFDSIAIGDVTEIEGTSAADVISIGMSPTSADGISRLGGVGRLASTTGLTIDGELSDGGARDVPVAATIDAGAGNDTVHASDLGDTVFGGAGNDTLYGGRLDDWLLGGDGDDVLNAGSATAGTRGGDGNYLDGGAGNDLLIGREGSDWLEGGDGTDRLEGGDGGDVLAGGAGAGDVMHGGRGDDHYIFRLGDSTDTASDASGIDLTAVVRQAYAGSTANDAAALSGALFRTGAGLNNWRGGGAHVTESGIAGGGEDALVLGMGIGVEDIKLTKSADGKDLIVEIWPDSVFSGDRIVLQDWFNLFNRIEILRFADGNELRLSDFDTFILGSDGNEVIVGTAGNDFVHAGGGNDQVYMLAGNDVGNGGLGNDSVSGDSGNDIVVGMDGDDSLYGGSGNDSVSGGRGNDYLTGDSGNDILAGGRGDDEVIGGAGDDVFKYQRGDGADTLVDQLSDEWVLVWISGRGGVDANGNTTVSSGTGYWVEPDGSLVHKTGGVVDETVFNAAASSWNRRTRYDIEHGWLYVHKPANENATAADGGAGDLDILEFGIGIDINDLQFRTAANGRDLIVEVGPGDQIVLKEWVSNAAAAGSIEKFAFFNTGAIDVSTMALAGGTDGNDTVTATAGKKNWLTGGDGDDTITGGTLDDLLNGNAGQDTLSGGAGADILLGGNDNDTLIGGAGADKLIGGAGVDIASYETATAGVTASLTTPTSTASDAFGDTFDGIEGLRGSAYADTLEGDSGDNDLTGGKGNDTLRGGGGDDFYSFGRLDGTDTIVDTGSGGEDLVVDASGRLQGPYVSTVQMVDRDGALYQFEHLVTHAETGAVIYRKEHSSSNVNFTAPTTFDPAFWVKDASGAAIYTISGSKVYRNLAAPGGSDTILFEDYTGLAGYTGFQVIGLSDLTFQFDSAGGAPNRLIITLDNGGGTIKIDNFRNGASADANSAIEYLQFSDGSSVHLAGLKFDSAGNLLAASTDTSAAPVEDFIVSDAATLSGGYGNDTLLGGAAGNTLLGGDGDDLLVGGLGADTLDGGAGIDTASYAASDGAVSINLANATAQPTVTSSDSSGDILTGIENVHGTRYADYITGDAQANVLKGNLGNDSLTGGLGDDVLIGDDGNDTLRGNVHDDNLDGGIGNDILDGGGDRDVLSGGDGNDILQGDGVSGNEAGGNLLTNFSFEDSGGSADDVAQSYGLTTTDLPGWTLGAARPVPLATSASGVTPSLGARAIHLDDGTGNVEISQTVAGLSAGEALNLLLSAAGRTTTSSSGFQVLWNGQVVMTFVNGTSTMTNRATGLTAREGTNVLTIRGTGAVDGLGAIIDNIRLTRAGGAADQLIGGAGIDRLEGGSGNDVLLGGDGDDNASQVVTGTTMGGLYGGMGDDLLDGGAGDDTLDGGGGADRYIFRAGSGNDTVTTGGGADELLFDGLSWDRLWFSQPSGSQDLMITAIGGGASVRVLDWFASSAGKARRIVAGDKALSRFDVQTLMTAMAAQSGSVPSTWPAAPSAAFTSALAAAWQDQAAYVDRAVVTGTAGNDFLQPDKLADGTEIWSGPVRFEGLDGDDVVDAGSADDVIAGGGGADTLLGGLGDDEFRFGADAGFDSVDGGSGTDSIVATVNSARINLQSLANVERITGAGLNDVQISTAAGGTLDLSAVAVQGISQINGASGAETIVGSSTADRIFGGAGNDTLSGGEGDDWIQGGDGTDGHDGGGGVDTLDQSFSSTAQVIDLALGQITIGGVVETAVNFESVLGGLGADSIVGSAAANRLDGGGGNDTIDAGDGTDVLIGGAGADILKGGLGTDTASYESQTAASSTTSVVDGVTINGVAVNLATATSTNGSTAPTAANRAKQGDAEGDWFYQVENLVGSRFNDALTGDAAANVLTGGAGSDVIDGGIGTDVAVFEGKISEYTLSTSAGVTTVTGIGARAGDGADRLRNVEFLRFADVELTLGLDASYAPVLGEPRMADQSVNDGIAFSYQIPATSFIDLDLGDGMTLSAALADGSPLPSWLTFTAATRTFSGTVPLADVGKVLDVKVTATDTGGSVSDSFVLTINQAPGADINGTTGADVINGTFRAEKILGNAGDDTIRYSGGADQIDGGAGTDLLDYSAATTGATADLAAGTGTGGATLAGIEKVLGSAFADTLTGSAFQDDLRGGAGDDTIDGGAGSDLIEGGLGADTLRGGAGVDTIYARTKADGSLEDVVDGGAGVDDLRLGGDPGIAGSDYGAKLDLSTAGSNIVSIENVVGTDFADEIVGNEFANIIKGGLGNDILSGGDGGDTLEGGAGNDTLYGGNGADRLDGGAGIDLVSYYRLTANGAAPTQGVTVDLTTHSNNTGIAAGDVFVLIENVMGTTLADSLFGDALANVLYGREGNDTLRGQAGNDTLFGGYGDDSLWGGAGNDTIDGSVGIDTLGFEGFSSEYTIDYIARTVTHNAGGNGVDTYTDVEFLYFAGDNLTLTTNPAPTVGTPGLANQSFVDNANFSYVVPTTAFNDLNGNQSDPYKGLTFTATQSNGSALPSWLVFDPATKTFSYTALAAAIGSSITVRVTASDGASSAVADFTVNVTQGPGAAITGTTANDTLSGTFRDETITALDGDDTIHSSAGADAIDGGVGADRIFYNTSTAGITISLAGGTGVGGYAQGDVLTNIESLFGSSYDDTITGSIANNLLSGGLGNDTIYGGDGSDNLSGGAGNDALYGGAGNDTLMPGLSLATGTEIVDGGDGIDSVHYWWLEYGGNPAGPYHASNPNAVTVDLLNPAANAGLAAGDQLISIENVHGTSSADWIAGDHGVNALYGYAGNDIIYGRDGNDYIQGDQHNDTLYGEAGNDTLRGGTENDTLDGGAGTDTLYGDDGDDLIHATVSGEDTIDGGNGIDTVTFVGATAGQGADMTNVVHKLTNVENITGSAFDDTLRGSTASNRLDGGAGNDTIEGRAGGDVLIGGLGVDWLSYTSSAVGATFQTAAIGGSVVGTTTIAAAQVRTLNGVNVDIAANTATGADATGDTISGFENLEGSAFADHLRGSAADTAVYGLGGDDVIYGGAGNDTLRGGAGNDFIFGEAGADDLYGDDGDDRLFGDGDSDRLYGGAGNDLLDAGDAGDYLDGGAGSDTMIGGAGADHYVIQRNAGADTIYNFDDDSALDSVSYEQADNVQYSELWMQKSGRDLTVKILGTTTVTTIKDWFLNTTANDWTAADNFYVDVFIAGARVNRQVDLPKLLAVMSTTPEPTSFSALSASKRAEIENGWGQNAIPTVAQVAGNPTTVNEDGSINLRFTVADAETAAAGITIVATTDGVLQTVVPASDVRVIDATTREVTIRPQANLSGTGNLRIRAFDGGLYSNELAVPITVNAVNDAPNAPTVSFDGQSSFSENSVAVRIATLTRVDIDSPTPTLVLQGADAAHFQILNGNEVWTKANLNYEAINKTALSLQVAASDGSLTSAAWTRNVTFNNVNEAPNALTIATDGVSSVNENGTAARVVTLTRTDPDGTVPSLVLQGADAAYFTIVNGNEIWTVANINYETKPSLSLQVVASDGSLTSAAWTRTVTVGNVNEAPNALTIASDNTSSVNENSAAVRIVTLNRTDPDGTVPSLVLQGADAGYFTIVNGNEIWTVANINYEAKASLSLQVVASDGSLTSAAWTRTVSVANVNEAPTSLTVSPVAFNENVAGALVANLSAADPDSGATFTYSIVGGVDAAKFVISGATLRLAAGQSLNFEAGSAVVDLRVSDGSLTYTRTGVQITSTNVNEAPGVPAVSAEGTSAVAENSGATRIATLSFASDPEGTASSLVLQGADAGYFQILNGNQIWTVANLNYESRSSLSLQVAATDGTMTSGAWTRAVSVTDVNETPSFTTAASGSISETAAVGSQVGSAVNSSDPDAGAWGRTGHRYSIVGGTGSSYFAINATSGVITTAAAGAPLDYDAGVRSYSLVLRVTDNNGTGLTADQTYTVNVTAVAETPNTPTVATDGAYSFSENSGAVRIATLTRSDPDGTTPALVIQGVDSGYFQLLNSNEVWTVANLNYEAINKSTLSLQVVATDGSLVSGAWTRNVTFTNVNEAPGTPTLAASGAASVNENAAATHIATLNRSDPDGTTPTLYLTGTDASRFQILNGNQVWTVAGLDHEAIGRSMLTAQVYASDGSLNSGVWSTSVTLNNLDDTRPVVTGINWYNGGVIAENSGIGVALGTVSVYDPDTASGSISLTLADTRLAAVWTGSAFEIRTAVGFNYEALPGATNDLNVGPTVWLGNTLTASDPGGSGPGYGFSHGVSDIAEQAVVWDRAVGPVTTLHNYSGPNSGSYAGRYANGYILQNDWQWDGYYTITNAERLYFDSNYSGTLNSGDLLISTTTGYQFWDGTSYSSNQIHVAGYMWEGAPMSRLIGQAPPVVLDLSGEGLGTRQVSVEFDIDGDGTRDSTGWISGGQAFLALDRNANGTIDSGAEISFLADKPGARTDLEALQAFDSNGDGVLDASDSRFGEFLVWQDADEDGVSDAGELKSLTEAGIAAISLAITATGGTEGVINVLGTSSFTRTDGTTGAVGDVALRWGSSLTAMAASLADTTTLPAQPLPPGSLIAWDEDGNGSTDPDTETYSLTEALTAFDSDGNARITSDDERYDQLRLWTDTNGNGRTELSELTPLAALGLTSLGLSDEGEEPEPGTGPVDTSPPKLDFARESMGFKAKKFRLHASGGKLFLRPKNADSLVDARAGALGPATILTFRDKSFGLLAPIVLDLDGDGVTLESRKKSRAAFDMDGDGRRDDTGWIGKRDGMLVIDRNGDGLITEGSELTFLEDAPSARSDLEALKAFDSNNDNKLDANDARFGEFRIWVDADGDGVSDAGELRSLAAAGIAELSLAGQAVDGSVKLDRNVILATSTFKRTDGSVGTLGDVALAFRPGSAGAAPASGSSGKGPAASLFGWLHDRRFDRVGLDGSGLMSDDVQASRVTRPALDLPESAAGEARRLALLLQDMAAFGTQGGIHDQDYRREAVRMPLDFFA